MTGRLLWKLTKKEKEKMKNERKVCVYERGKQTEEERKKEKERERKTCPNLLTFNVVLFVAFLVGR